MIVSHKHKFIHFLPWKCGSSTAQRRFAKYNESPYPDGSYFNKLLLKQSNKHIGLSDFLKLPEASLGYYKISFVRNPYDRLYSGFLQRWQSVVVNGSQPNAPDSKIVPFGWSSWLKDYVVPRFLKDSSVFGRFCHEYTHYEGDKYVDFVGRIERMDSDTQKICDRLGLSVDYSKVNNVKTSYKLTNPFGYKYIDKYSAEQIEIVNKIFAKDIELFGYKFEK